MPPTPSRLWGARDVGAELLRIGLRRERRGPVSEVVTSDVRLDRLPALTTWPDDGGPFITLPTVFTEHPDGRGHNLGMYRLQVHDARTTGMHWQIGKGGGFHHAVAEGRGEALPVTVFLGGPPALILAAVAPLPENVPELMLASLIAGGAAPGRGLVGRTRCRRPSRPDRVGAAGDPPPRGAVRRPLRVLLAAPQLPRLPRRPGRAPPRRHLPRHRGRQAPPGGLLHRRPPAGPAVAAVPRRHARRRAALVVRRDRLPLAVGGRRQAALRPRGDGQRVPHTRRGAALAHQVPAGDGPTRRPARLPGDARARAGPDQSRDRPVRVLQPVDGHPRLHRAGREPRLEGRVAGARRPRPRAPRRVLGGRAARGHRRGAGVLPRVPRGRGESAADEPGCRLGWRPIPRSGAGRWWS